MICRDCPKFMWFGDYNLHYCDISRNTVSENDECEVITEWMKAAKEVIAKNNARLEELEKLD